MSLDERGSEAAQALREQVLDDLAPAAMLAAVPLTRTRRRLALAAPLAAVAVAVVLIAAPGHPSTAPGPSAPSSTPAAPSHHNGVLFGAGTPTLMHPPDVHVPPLGDGSSPTWSPDGREVAVMAGGILVTDTATGSTRRIPCPGCQEIAWSPDGRTFAAPGAGGEPLGLVDADTGAVSSVPVGSLRSVYSVTWAPNGQRLAFLASAPRSAQGAYSVNRDGSQLWRFAAYPTSLATHSHGLSVLLATRWSPTSDRIAVLSATPSRPENGYPGPYALFVQTYHPDGSGQSLLVGDGHCDCIGFQPNMAWSPDGTSLAVYSSTARRPERRLDVDGRSVEVRFLAGGGGALSWQPLPVDP